MIFYDIFDFPHLQLYCLTSVYFYDITTTGLLLKHDVVDKVLNALNKEDGMVFNKIRTNRTQLEKEIAASKEQCVKQNQANNTLHAVVVDLENRLDGHGKMQKILECQNLVMSI